MSDETQLSNRLRELAANAARASVVAQEASSLSLFSKFAAIEACRANPYQPFLVWHPTTFGSLMQLDLRERVSQDIFMFGAFEPELLWFMACILQCGETFFDCGAHIGFFSLAAGLLVGPKGQVDAFEPIAATKAHLDTNVRNAKLDNIRTHPLAVWSRPETIQIFDFGPVYSAFNSVGSPRLPLGDKSPEGRVVRVPATSLDAFVDASGRIPSFVKIDVESSEDQVLQGMTKILTEARPTLVLEVGDFDHAEYENIAPTQVLLQRLVAADYALLDLRSRQITPHDVKTSEKYGYANIAAVPIERLDEITERTKSAT
jgi:FkbM family methyltransferase